MSTPAPHLHLERLELDLRGLPPETAQAAVRALAPALHAALTQPAHPIPVTRHMSAADLSRAIAQRLATAIRSRTL